MSEFILILTELYQMGGLSWDSLAFGSALFCGNRTQLECTVPAGFRHPARRPLNFSVWSNEQYRELSGLLKRHLYLSERYSVRGSGTLGSLDEADFEADFDEADFDEADLDGQLR